MTLHWMAGEGWQCAYGREHGYLVLTGEAEVRLARFPVDVAAAGLVARVAREAAASVVIFPLGRGPGRPGMAPELAALASSARVFAECYESGESLPGYPAWQQEPLVTKAGHMLSGADVQALADEAERGYDVTKIRPRGPAARFRETGARLHYHEPFEVERECRELHELPGEDPLADLRVADGHVPDYNRAEADRRLAALPPAARFRETGDANDCPNC